MRIILCIILLYFTFIFHNNAAISAGENPVFRNVMVKGHDGNYMATGEARTGKGMFLYSVENGHVQLMKETQFIRDTYEPRWRPFSIPVIIPKKDLPKNGSLILNLYERNPKGKIIHLYPAVLERFP